MSRKRYTPKQIISMLREAEVALAQGQSIGQACCQWQAKIAQFWQSKISHLERAVVPPSRGVGGV